MDIQHNLAQVRISKGLTQEELALKCKVTTRTIQRIESGQVHPRPHTIRAISHALGFDFQTTSETPNRPKLSPGRNDFFNLKTQTMKKISFLTSSLLAAAAATFFLVTKIQAQSVLVETPKSGVSISYNSDRSIKRIDAVFTNELTLDSLISISKKLEKSDVFLKYRSMEFGIDGQLTGISCEVSDRTQQASGSVSVGYLDSLNSEKTYGFYFDYSPAAKSPFCSGSCW